MAETSGPMTGFASDNEIEEIAAGLRNRSLPEAKWTHAAHFAAAVWLLRHSPGFVWRRDMPGIIRAYNESVGKRNTDTSGYHETITFASMRAAEHFLAGLPEETPTFRAVNLLLETRFGRKDWLFDHWRRDTLFGAEARRRWVDPDLTEGGGGQACPEALVRDAGLREPGQGPGLARAQEQAWCPLILSERGMP